MIPKDWMRELADAIQDEAGVDSSRESARPWLLEIIKKHCPMKSDVAYMPVPRCDGCKHWGGGNEDEDGRKDCRHNHAGIGPQNEELMTAADFGCVEWEAK